MTEETNTVNHLLLKIEEHRDNEKLATVYVLYDTKLGEYVLYGKPDEGKTACTYTFRCKSENDLETFLSFVICKKSFWTFTLYVIDYDYEYKYNYQKLSYNILKSTINSSREISGYNKQTYNKNENITILSMLKNIRNF